MNHQGLLIRASPTVWHIGLASFNFYKNDKNTSPTVRHTAWQILATRKNSLSTRIYVRWARLGIVGFAVKKSLHRRPRAPPCTFATPLDARRRRLWACTTTALHRIVLDEPAAAPATGSTRRPLRVLDVRSYGVRSSNPATGELLDLPPPPCTSTRSDPCVLPRGARVKIEDWNFFLGPDAKRLETKDLHIWA